MVIAPVDRIQREVAQRVVHPPHVPLEVEPEAAVLWRRRHARKRRGFLGNRQGAWKIPVHRIVHLPQKFDCLEVLAPAVAIRQPFAGIAAVVKV